MTVIAYWVELLAVVIDLAAVAILVWGVVKGLWWFGGLEFFKIIGRGGDIRKKDMRLRDELGGYLLLGLEFMIASDIIHTVISRTTEDLLFLGGIVIIRTVISFFLTREMAHNAEPRAAAGHADAVHSGGGRRRGRKPGQGNS